MTADETSDIAPKVAGKVTNVYANVGEFVASGKTIAKIDDKDARLRLAEAQANVKQSQAAVRQAEARLGLTPTELLILRRYRKSERQTPIMNRLSPNCGKPKQMRIVTAIWSKRAIFQWKDMSSIEQIAIQREPE